MNTEKYMSSIIIQINAANHLATQLSLFTKSRKMIFHKSADAFKNQTKLKTSEKKILQAWNKEKEMNT